MGRDIPRPSRRAVRFSLTWQAPALRDPPERRNPGAGDAGAVERVNDPVEDTAADNEAQARDGAA